MSRILPLCALLLAALPARAQSVPGTITFSARVSDGGTPVTGAQMLTFHLYERVSGGMPLWTEQHTATLESDGTVHVLLGSLTSLDPGVLSGAPLFLEVTVGSNTLSPRMPVVSVPYAIRAGMAATADTLGPLGPEDVVTGITTANGITAARTGGQVSLSVNPNTLQLRVRGACGTGESVRSILEDGTLLCGPFNTGDVTGVLPGAGLAGGGMSGDATLSLMSCANGQILRSDATGGWICSTDVVEGDITAVLAAPGGGLAGGDTSGVATLSLASCPLDQSLISSGTAWGCDSLFSGTAGRLVRFTSGTRGASSVIQDNGTNVGIGQAPTAGMQLSVDGDVLVNGWARTVGNTGWYSQTHGGGWHMSDATYVRVYGGKQILNARTRGLTAWNEAHLVLERGAGSTVAPGLAFHNPAQMQASQIFGNANASGGIIVMNAVGATAPGDYAPVFASAFNTGSDLRIKKDIAPLGSPEFAAALDAIRRIQSIRFRYKNEVSEETSARALAGKTWRAQPHLGVSAQSLPPEVVVPMASPVEGAEPMLGVSLADMDGLLVAGVKGLDAEVQVLREAVAARDRRIAELEARVAGLKALEARIRRLEQR